MLKKQRTIQIVFLATIVLMAVLFFINGVLAIEVGIEPVEEEIELGGQDIRVIIARIINVALGLLGIIALLLVLYGGFLWMTAGGDDEKVAKAKKVLINAVIGLAIVLSSFAISRFVLDALVSATTEGPPSGPPGIVGGPGVPGGGVRVFSVQSMTPQGSVPIRNVTVRILFNANVDSTTVENNIRINRISDGIRVDGTYSVLGSRVSFVPSAACPEPNEDRKCFGADTEYEIIVAEGLRSSGGLFINCTGLAANCEGRFMTGDLVDVADPSVEITYPDNGQGVPVNSIITLQAYSEDDAGVSLVDFEIEGSVVASDGPPAPTPLTFTAETDWDTSGYTLGSRHDIRARAYDIDDNSALSSAVSVVVRAEHCFNGIQDGGETGIDCGGDPASDDYCGACSGSSCTSDEDCSSGYCEGGVCISRPIIESVDPLDGAPGTLVTITGQYFGVTRGEVKFLGAEAEGDEMVAPFAPCARVWANNQIIITVPEGAVSGPIEVTTFDGDADVTNDTRGPNIPDFLINTIEHPGICEINPEEGETGTTVTISGIGFGATEDSVTFGEVDAGRIDSWSDETVRATVPPLSEGDYPVRVSVSGTASNGVNFTVVEEGLSGVPIISQIEPAAGPIGQYITIYGSNFGSSMGRLTFINPSTGQSALGAVDFPEECGDDIWHRDNITVKVPDDYSDGTALSFGAHEVRVQRSDGRTSEPAEFTVNDDPLAPGICRISPAAGPVGTGAVIYGERLGATTGAVTFYDSKEADVTDWSDEEITTEVPSGAITGTVTATSAAGITSNGINFQVANCIEEPGACESDQQCCPDGTCIGLTEECAIGPTEASFVWRFSTGIIPITPQVIEACMSEDLPASPSPWSERSGGEDVCINAVPTVRFNVPMDAARFTSDNIEFKKCIGGVDDPCASTVDVGVATITVLDANRGFQIIPSALFDTESWYEVKLSTNLRGDESVGSLNMEEDEDCGEGYGYCFTWKTSERTDPCTIGNVSVTPDYYIARDTNPIEYSASAIGSEDICLSLNPSAYDWLWSSSDLARASVAVPDPLEGWIAAITPILETLGVPVDITAEAVGQGLSDSGQLVVDFTDPAVTSYEPECTEACINAVIRIGFNTLMDSASILAPGNIQIYKCENENCRTFVGGNLVSGITPVDPLTWQEIIISHADFDQRSYYRVILNGDIKSYTLTELTNLNYGENFSWTFRTKDDPNPCVVDRVEVAPEIGYTSSRGERVVYTAVPYGEVDECSTEGQALNPWQYDWGWSVDDTLVGELIDGGTIDTSLENISRWCDAKTCLHLGTETNIAVCGNGIAEVSLGEECDDGNTSAGDGCSSNCLTEPVASFEAGGTCGNADIEDVSYISPWANPWIEGAEECDDGNNIFGDGCSPGCQNEGSTLAGSVCGNADLGDGEDCDDGNRRAGDGCSPECLREGSMPGPLGVCGNGAVEFELGEDCDDGRMCADGTACTSNSDCIGIGEGQCRPRSGDGCSERCLNEGTYPCIDSTDPNCCGNAVVENGEDCDGEEGCGINCLFLGSSYTYSAPSFCGDGTVGLGEERGCDAGAPDGRSDAVQIVEAIGLGEVDEEGNQSTVVNATADGVSGAAQFTMLCGFTLDAECKAIDRSLGLAANSCCYPMPLVEEVIPANGSNEMCLNAAIQVRFSESLDRTTLSYDDEGVSKNRILVIAGQDTACGEGETIYPMMLLTDEGGKVSWWRLVLNRITNFFKGFLVKYVRAAAEIDPRTLNYCESNIISGDLGLSGDGQTVRYRLSRALDPDTWYQIRVLPGIESEEGVAMDNFYMSAFGTGTEICKLDYIYIKDPTGTYFFDRVNPATIPDPYGARSFIALAVARRTGLAPMAIEEIPGNYEWEWSWSSSEADDSENNIISVTDSDQQDQMVTPAGKTGEEQVSAQARITVDTFFGRACMRNSDCPRNLCVGATETDPGHCAGETVSDSVTAMVNLCENPWPDPEAEPLTGYCTYYLIERVVRTPCTDDTDCTGVPCEVPEESPAYFADPLDFHFATMYCRDNEPNLLPKLKINVADPPSGVLRDYLLTYDVDPTEGAPYAKDAIGLRIMPNPDHLTPEEWYRTQGFGGSPESMEVDGYPAVRVGTTVYVNAANKYGDPTLFTNIYILSHNDDADPMTISIYNQLLANLVFNYDNVSNERLCRGQSGEYLRDEAGKLVKCSSNLDCLDLTDPDPTCDADKDKLRRDVQRITDLLHVEELIDTYRVISGGRRSCALRGSDLSFDCVEDSECKFLDPNATCDVFGGTVPRLEAGSFLRALSTSLWPSWQSELGTSFGESLLRDPINQFAPCEGYEQSTCFNSESLEFMCPEDSLVYMYRSLGDNNYELLAEMEYADYWLAETLPDNVRWNEGCHDTTYSNNNLCGDGFRGPEEECELGETMRVLCEDGISVRYVSCMQDGTTCRWAEPGESGHGECQDSFPICGNGVREGYCLGGDNEGLLCNKDADCLPPDGYCDFVEFCDEGENNGLYGHCANDCSAEGAYCGDGLLAGAEECDLGETNGQYESGCSWDCRLPGPMCGDDIVQSEEECEAGQSEDRVDGYCQYYPDISCTSDTDCPGHGAGYFCPGTIKTCTPGSYCAGYGMCEYRPKVTNTTCIPPCGTDPSTGYQLKRVRSCNETTCEWGSWSMACVTDNACGNGILEGEEECDDGNTDNTDGCIIVPGRESDLTVSCKFAYCDDGYRYSGVEQCDAGSGNGIECEAPYEGSCTYCTERCTWATASGTYCGDGIIEPGIEECDEGPISCWYPDLGESGSYHPLFGEIPCDPYGDSSECPRVLTLIGMGGMVLGEHGESSSGGTTYAEGVCQGQGISYEHVPAIPPDPPFDYNYNRPYCDYTCHIAQRGKESTGIGPTVPYCGDGIVQPRPYPPLPWTPEGRDYWEEIEEITGELIKGKQNAWSRVFAYARRVISLRMFNFEMPVSHFANYIINSVKVAYGVLYDPVFEPCATDAHCPGDQICWSFGDDTKKYCYRCDNPDARSGCVKVLSNEGEVCDSGTNNDVYSPSIPPNCNRTCSALASYCGDGIVDYEHNESCDWGGSDFSGRVDMVLVTTMPNTTSATDGVCDVYESMTDRICPTLESVVPRFDLIYDVEKTFYLANPDYRRPTNTTDEDILERCIDNMIREGVLQTSGGTTIEGYSGLPGHSSICGESWAASLGGCSGGLFTRPSGQAHWAQAVADITASHPWRSDSVRLIIVVDNNRPQGAPVTPPPSWNSEDGNAIRALQTYFNTLPVEQRPRLAVMVDKNINDYGCIWLEGSLGSTYNRDRFIEEMGASSLWSVDKQWGSGAKYQAYSIEPSGFINTGSIPTRVALENIMNSIFCDIDLDGVTDCTCLAPPKEGTLSPWCL